MRASVMKSLNGALLLDLIRRKGPVSRAELARLSGLTKPTVSSQVAGLVRRGLVLEQGAGGAGAAPRAGKPAQMLRFNAAWGLIAGAEIGSSRVRGEVADLNGAPLDREEAAVRPERGPEALLETLERSLKEMLARRRSRGRRLLAMVIAAPGRVDAGTGVVLEAGNLFHWRNVAVRGRFERAFRTHVAVDNDVNLAVLGELHHGVGRGARNLVLIRLDTGVGAGVVLNGHLYQGSHWAAGEIGHMIFDRDARCRWFNERGYLESLVASDVLRERAERGAPSGLTALSGGADLPGALARAAERNDPLAAAILDDLAANLGMAVANLAAALDPELVVLVGKLFDLVTDRIREVAARAIRWPLRIERSSLGDDSVLRGAVSVACAMAHGRISGRGRKEVSEMIAREGDL